MKYIIYLFLVSHLYSCAPIQDDESGVKEVFEEYKSSLMDKDGAAVARCVDRKTLAYYDRLAELTRTADSTTVSAQSIYDKLCILSVRLNANKKQIDAFTGRGFLAYSIAIDLIDSTGISKIDIGTISVRGDSARGQIIDNGKGLPASFLYYKENGKWKIDLISIFPSTEKTLSNAIKGIEGSEDEIVIRILQMDRNKPISHDIWSPLK